MADKETSNKVLDRVLVIGNSYEIIKLSKDGLSDEIRADLAFETLSEDIKSLVKLGVSKEDKMQVEGFATVYGNRNSRDQVLYKGMFDWMKTDKKLFNKIKVMERHEHFIGVPLLIEDRLIANDVYGLFYKGQIANSARGQDVIALIDAGVYSEMSIGFIPLEWSWVEAEDGVTERHITKGMLIELTHCPWGANPDTLITNRLSTDYKVDVLADIENTAKALKGLSVENLSKEECDKLLLAARTVSAELLTEIDRLENEIKTVTLSELIKNMDSNQLELYIKTLTTEI